MSFQPAADEVVALDRARGVVVIARVCVVEAVDRRAGKRGHPADAFPLPAGLGHARGLVQAHGVEVLAGVGVVEAVHVGVGVLVGGLGLGGIVRGVVGSILVRFILVIWRVTSGFVRLVAIVALVRRCRRIGVGRLVGLIWVIGIGRVVGISGVTPSGPLASPPSSASPSLGSVVTVPSETVVSVAPAFSAA